MKILVITFLSLIFSSQKNTGFLKFQTGTAYAATWQNDYNYWFAVGPLQATSSGYKTEEEALEKVARSWMKGYELKKVKSCNGFNLYTLGYDYGSRDIDVIEYIQKKGYNCD